MAVLECLPTISIVTPSYNQGEFLEECIDSVLSQKYPHLEYVIMDGGSSDNSLEIILKYKKYLSYWQSKPDGGQYQSIQEGFSRTSGEIMAWINSDDKYHINAFWKAAYIFCVNNDIEWVTGRHTFWKKDGTLLGVATGDLPLFNREYFLRKKYREVTIQQESTFWRRSLWERSGARLASQLSFAGDLELWVRFFRSASLYQVEQLLGGYRKHGNQKAVLNFHEYFAEAEEVINSEIAQDLELLPTLQPDITTLVIEPESYRQWLEEIYSGTDLINNGSKVEVYVDFILNQARESDRSILSKIIKLAKKRYLRYKNS